MEPVAPLNLEPIIYIGSCAAMVERTKIEQRLLAGGTEPDPRFTLANERTFLAWIRTSLALLASGIAVEAFTIDIFYSEVRKGLASSMLTLSLLVSLSACLRWLNVERAMRQKAPLPLPLLLPLLSLGCSLMVAVFLGFSLLRGV